MIRTAEQALNKLCKWRLLYVGKLLGTRIKGDPQAEAVRDLLNTLFCLRAEASALAGLLISKGVFTAEEFDRRLAEEADFYDKAIEKTFPGFRTTDDGVEALDAAMAAETTRNWPK